MGGITAEVADTFSIVDRYTPVVVCLRARVQLPDTDGGFPIHCDSNQSRVHESAFGRRRIWPDSSGVPEGHWGGPAGIPTCRGHRRMDTAVPVFYSVRAVDGLPRVPSEPHPGSGTTRRGDNREAVAYGLRSTAGIITGCALIMVAVFGAFASGDTIINQQVGFGLAVAVLLDATLVRSVLVPASMEFLGHRNWYLPSFLRWLSDVRVEPEEE